MTKQLRILVLKWENEILIDGLAAGFRSLGHEITVITLERQSEWTQVEALVSASYDLWVTHCTYVFDFWKYRDELRSLVEKRAQKVALWYWESPYASGTHRWLNEFLRQNLPKSFHFFLPDRAHVKLFSDRGYNANHLPLAALDEWFLFRASPTLSEHFHDSLVFVGTPNKQVQFALVSEADRIEAFSHLFAAEFVNYLKQDEGLQILEEEEERYARMLAVSVSPFMKTVGYDAVSFDRAREMIEKSLSLVVPERWAKALPHMRGRLEILYSWREMLSLLNSLIEDGLRVYGGDEWKTFLLPQLRGATPRLSEEELAASFQSASLQICYTKRCFPHVVHERPLKILAHGGFALTDQAEAVKELFPEGGLETYGSVTELREKSRFYAKNGEARKSLIELGQKWLYKYHRMIHRAEKILRDI